MKTPTNSTLQRRILLSLANKNASSISALARDLDTKRPSVSRAVKLLADTNLIARQQRAVSLTETGQEEVTRIMMDVPVQAKKATDVATYILSQAAEPLMHTKPFDDMPEILRGVPSRQMMEAMNTTARMIESLPSRQMMETMNTTAKMMKGLAGHQLLEAMNGTSKMMDSLAGRQLMEAINTTVRVQTINLEWLKPQPVGVSAALNHLFIKNNAIIGNMMADLEAITQINTAKTSLIESLIGQTADVTTAYGAYYSDIAKRLNQVSTTMHMNTRIVIPTLTTSSFVGSVRSIAESKTYSQEEGHEPTQSELSNTRIFQEQYLAMTPILESYLTPLGSRFVRRWNGAWQTLSSESEDRHSQALHSGRELLMQVLAILAPEDVFTEEDWKKHNAKKPTRRMQASYILDNSKTSVEWVDKIAAAIDSTYDILAARSHSRDDKFPGDATAASLLSVLGGLLIFLLENQDKSSS